MSTTYDEEVIEKTQLKEPKKYNIWALNNDITAFNEVVFILIKALGMSESVAAEITVKVDQEGRAKVNPKPMSKGIAQATLDRIKNVQRQYAATYAFGLRKKEVMELKFVIKED